MGCVQELERAPGCTRRGREVRGGAGAASRALAPAKATKGSALPCDGETALGALAQFCGCQLRMMRLKARPLVFTAERGGRKWMFSLGLSRGDKRNNRSRKSQEGK